MNQRRYRGRLLYDGSPEYLEVESFIVRTTAIAYSLASVSQVHGKWVAESGKPAVLQTNGHFLVKNVFASRLGVRSTSAWTIEFVIESEDIGKTIEVSGSIEEGGEVGPFYGELVGYA